MIRIFGKFTDGFVITYRIPTTHTVEVFSWLKGLKIPGMEVWIEEEK